MPPKTATQTRGQTIAASAIPAAVGLATSLGTSIPGLRKPKKLISGSQAAREVGSRAAGAVQGAASTGFGASRGLAARTGARAAEQQTRAAAEQAGGLALKEGQLHRQNLDARNERLAAFGADLVDTTAQITQGAVEARAAQKALQGEQRIQDAQAAISEQPELAADPTGLGGGAAIGASPAANQAQVQQAQQQALATPVPGVTAPAPTPLAPVGSAFDMYGASLGMEGIPELKLAPVLERKLRLTRLASDEANRRGIPLTSVLAQMQRQIGSIQLTSPFDEFGTGTDALDEGEF